MAVVWALAFAAVSLGAAPQLLPPPKDGDIRDVYWELRKESETWLSLELKTEDGRPAPFLTFTHFYSGKPPGPPASQIEVRAYGWAPFADLVFVINDKQTIDLTPPGGMLSSGTPSDFARGTLTLDLLEQLARAGRITGQTLGVSFVLRDSQRKALAAFYDRVSGRKPRTATSEALATEHPRRIGVTTVRSGR
jgi:hypothetical protein